MESQDRNNVSISGAGSINGGVYDTVTISGAGKVRGDLDARQVKLSGASTIAGSIKAETVSASGAFKVKGRVDATELKCSGAGKIFGTAKADNFQASGAVNVRAIKAGQCRLSGACSVDGDVEAEHFRAGGAFRINGLLNADTVEISLHGHSKAREIGGTKITVVRAGSRRGDFGHRWRRTFDGLEVDSIEGDEVYLEGTRAAVVRGTRVTIGPGCRIDTVEYGESLRIDPDAEVKQRTYTGDSTPPPEPISGPVEPPDGWAKQHSGERHSVYTVRVGGWEVHHPVLKALIAGLAVIFAIVVVVGVLGLVLPAAATIVALVLALVAALLVVGLLIGLPILGLGAVGSVLLGLLCLPFELARRAISRSRRRSTTRS